MATLAQAEGDVRAMVRCFMCQQVSIAPFRLADVPSINNQFIYTTNCCNNTTLHCSRCAVVLPTSYVGLTAARLRCRYKEHCTRMHNDTVREDFVSSVMEGFATAAHDDNDQDSPDHLSAGPEPEIPSDSVADIPSDSVADIPSDSVANIPSDSVANIPSDSDDDVPIGESKDGFQMESFYGDGDEGEDVELLQIKGVTNGTDYPSLYTSQQPSQAQLHDMFPNWTDRDIAREVSHGEFYGDHPAHNMVLQKVFPETIDENLRVHGIGALLPKDSFLPTDSKKQATKLYSIQMHMLYRGKRLSRTNQQILVQVIQTSLDVGMNAVELLKSSNSDLKQSANVLEQNIDVFEKILVSYIYNIYYY